MSPNWLAVGGFTSDSQIANTITASSISYPLLMVYEANTFTLKWANYFEISNNGIQGLAISSD